MVQVKQTQILINNEWQNSVSGKTFAVINPSNEEKIADVQEGDKADIDKAVKAAVAAFKHGSQWRKMDAAARGRLLYKLATLVERDAEYLVELEATNNGKVLQQTKNEVQGIVHTLQYYAGWADKIHGKTLPTDSNGLVSYTKIEPVGVCGQIIPWNFPLMMFTWKIATALAAGCTVVLKPSEQTPLTALYMGQLIVEAGFPPGVVNIVPGYGPTAGAALVEHPNVDKIAFTGSTEVGKLIARKASDTLKRVSLELGGKSPLVVTENFDVQKAANIAYAGCFFNQGQCCCAATRTFVHKSVYEEFVKVSAEIAKKAVLGGPFEGANVTQGPQIDATQTAKVLELVESGKKEGARLVTGGNRVPNKKGYFIEPTIFADVTDQMRIAKEEIFGPVQQILKYSDLDEVIERCNNTEYGLAAGILSNNINQTLKFVETVQAGTVWVNNYLVASETTPFGGYKHSGYGREMGEDGLHEYCEIKSVVIQKQQV